MVERIQDDGATNFDHMDPAWTEDPFPLWKHLRERCPVAQTDRYGGLYMPTRYRDIAEAARRHDVFSSKVIVARNVALTKTFSAPPMNAVGDEHRSSRKRLLAALSRQSVEGCRNFIAVEARKLAASAASTPYDVAREFAYELSVRTLLHVVGAPQGDRRLLKGWTSNVLISGVGDAGTVERTAAEMAGYCFDLAVQSRSGPAGTMVSLLMADWDGKSASYVVEVAAMLRLILLAGIDTTASVLVGALKHLAVQPRDRARIAEEPESVPAAVEEFLRFYAPTTMARYVERDTALAGVDLRAGRLLLLPFPAANRDPETFPDPDRLDLARHPNRHLAFGAGIHRCIGDHLARAIISIGLREWLARHPDFCLEGDGSAEWTPGTVRGMSRLLIRLDARLDAARCPAPAEPTASRSPGATGARGSVELPAQAARLYGEARKLQAAGQFQAAIKIYRGLLQKHPHHVGMLLGMGAIAVASGKEAVAETYFQRVAAVAPHDFRPFHNLATLALKKSRLKEALAHAEAALKAAPDVPDAHRSMSEVLFAAGRTSEGLHHARRASDLKPDDVGLMLQKIASKRAACDWHAFEEDDRRLRDFAARGQLVPPFALLATEATNAEQHACAKRWAQAVARPKAARPFPPRKPVPGRPLRLGYLSGDFHDHATSQLVAELFESHDRARVAVFGYSYGPGGDSPLRERIVRSFDRFRDVKDASSEAIARRIYDDEVDILVDLKGYTSRARTEILAWRPAPVQVNYLGFPGTMGADFVDYVITDRNVSPPAYQDYSTERFAYLPHCFQPNDTSRPQPDGSIDRGQMGFPEASFVFCCFNAPYKLTPTVFSTWMRVLGAVPGSFLWLLSNSPCQNAHLRRAANDRGVSPDRLAFAPRASVDRHLARCKASDLFLDTVPVGAFTTASDALWAGLPLLTVAGPTPAGRGSTSLLRAMSLPELVVPDLEAYEAMAIQLARSPDRLRALRRRVERGRSGGPPFDTRGLARDLEALYARLIEGAG